MIVYVYTDGSVRRNFDKTYRGGWGFIITNQDESLNIQRFGSENNSTTSQRMEMQAVIEALKLLSSQSFTIKIVSDSKYVVDGITHHIKKWIDQDYKTVDYKTKKLKDVKNVDLWKELYKLTYETPNINIVYEWVRGHGDGETKNSKYNNIADKLANQGSDTTLDKTKDKVTF